jgi:hypothetical protein
MQTTPVLSSTEKENLFLAAQAGETYLRALAKVSEAKANMAKLEREEYESVSRQESSYWADRHRDAQDALHYATVNLNGWAEIFKANAREML